MGALAPMLTPSEPGERRSFLVAYPILSQSAADRQARSSEWAADIGEELRRQGQDEAARQAAADEAAKARGLDAQTGPRQRPDPPLRACAPSPSPRPPRVAEFGRRLDASVRRAGFAPLRLDLSQDVGVRRRRRPARRQPHPEGRLTRMSQPAARTARPGLGRGRGAAAGRLRPRPAHCPARSRPEAGPRLFRHAPRAGRGRPGRGWAPAQAPVSAWRMTTDQAPVFWPFISAPGLPPTGAQMGIDLLPAARSTPTRSAGCCDDDVPVTNPNIFMFGKPGPGQVRHDEGVLPADDGLRLPGPDPGRPQGRVRAAVPRLRRRTRSRSGTGMSTRINPLAFGPAAARLGPADARRGAGPRRGHLRPLAHPGPRPGRQPSDRRTAGAVRAHRRSRRQSRPADLTGYAAGNTG